MAYNPRSLNELSTSIRGAFRQYLPGTDATIRQNVLYVIAKVLALWSREYELRFEWVYKQLFLSTATDLGIVRMQAADYRIYLKPAAASSGIVTGDAQPNATYPAGVRFVSGGVTFVSTQPFTAGALGAFSATLQAEQRGFLTNRDGGAILGLADQSLYPTLPATVTVAEGGLGGGADVEDLESLRARALDRKARPPQGGALLDYEKAALDVPGVVKAWARQMSNDVGSVAVWTAFEGRPNGVPTSADLDAVTAAITARRLIRGKFFAVPMMPVPVDLTIQLQPDTSTNRNAVGVALASFFDVTSPSSRIRPGLPEEPFLLTEAWISEVISGVVGEDNHTLLSPNETLGFQAGELPVLGTVTWA